MEGLDEKDLEALREVTPAELDMDHDMGDAAEEQLEEQAEALSGLAPDDLDRIAKLYIEVLRTKLHQVRDSTYDKTLAKIQQKNDEKVGGQGAKLFGMSAMAAGSLVVAILMMSGVMLGMRTVEGSLGVAVLENAMQFKEDFDVFKSVASFFESIQSIFGYVPIVLTGLAILLFFVSIKDLIKDIVKAPERAMRGEIMALLPAPIGLVLGFLVIFVAAFGLKALLSIAKYKVAAPSADVVLGQASQALPPGVR